MQQLTVDTLASPTTAPTPAGPAQHNQVSSTWSEAPSILADIDLVLSDPQGCRARIRNGQRLNSLVRAMLLTTSASATVFGLVIGMFHGREQILYAGLKLPIALLLTLAISAPALTALNAALGRRASMREDIALVLASIARASLVLVALAPVILLLIHLKVGYHRLFLAIVASGGIAGLFGTRMLIDGLREASKRAWIPVTITFFLVFASVGPQMAWSLRPYLVRPRTEHVVLLRSTWKTLPEAIWQGMHSAVGIFRRVDQDVRTMSGEWVDPAGRRGALSCRPVVNYHDVPAARSHEDSATYEPRERLQEQER